MFYTFYGLDPYLLRWARPRFWVYDLTLEALLLFPKFGVGSFYTCVILEVSGISHYLCVIILCG